MHWIRTIAKIEWRNILANPWRNFFVAALIAVPVAGMVAGSNLALISEVTPAERIQSRLGKASLHVDAYVDPENLKTALPKDSVQEPISFGREELTANGSRLIVETCRVNLKGLAEGMFVLIEGEVPQEPGEIAVTPRLLEWWQKKMNDEVMLFGERAGTIVGVVENPERLSQMAMLYPYVAEGWVGETERLIELSDSADLAQVSAQLKGHVVADRNSLQRSDQSMITIVFVLGVVALAEAALIIVSAFVVGVRRRQREIGLLASSGATRFQILGSVACSALMVSSAGAVIGVLLGIGVSMAVCPYLDSWNGRRNGTFEFASSIYLSAMLFGILVAVGSAMIPAIGAARMSIKEALSSRRPVASASKVWAAVGFISLAIGIYLIARVPSLINSSQSTGSDSDNAALLSVAFGSLFGVCGFGAWSPWLLRALASCSARLPLSCRLAVRECGRFCSRNGPIVTAILAGTAMSITIAALHNSVAELDNVTTKPYRADQLMVTGLSAQQAAIKIESELGGTTVEFRAACRNRLPLVVNENESSRFDVSNILVGGAQLLRALGVEDNDGKILESMDQGNILGLNHETSKEIEIVEGDSRQHVMNIAMIPANGTAQSVRSFGYVVSPATVERLGWNEERNSPSESSWLVRTSADLTEKDLATATQLARELSQTSIESRADFKVDHSNIWQMFLVALVTGLVVIGTASALAVSEARLDQQILQVVGASPSVHRNVTAARSGYLAFLGCVLAVPAGLLPAYGLTSAVPQIDFYVPVFEIAFAVLGLPLIAYIATWVIANLMSIGRVWADQRIGIRS